MEESLSETEAKFESKGLSKGKAYTHVHPEPLRF